MARGVIWEWIANPTRREFRVSFSTNCRFPHVFSLSTLPPDPSHPAGKRKEIDNVMKKARQAPPNEYWDKKLLEAEEKDPGRWKHTGYKKMYVNGVRKSRSRSPMRKTPVSPHRGARNFPQSPMRRRMSRTPERYKPRSPPPSRYPREMVKPKEMYRPAGKGRPISPPPKVEKTLNFQLFG